jgi:hypothetical protein
VSARTSVETSNKLKSLPKRPSNTIRALRSLWLQWCRPPVLRRAAHQSATPQTWRVCCPRVIAPRLRTKGLHRKSGQVAPSRSNLRSVLVRASMGQCRVNVVQPSPPLGSLRKALPNPSLELTRSGKAHRPRNGGAYHPFRGRCALPPRSAQLKR